MKEFTPSQIARHLKWVYSRPGYYKEVKHGKRSRNNKRKTLSGLDQALHSRSRRRPGQD